MTISLLWVLVFICMICLNTLGHKINTLNDAIDYLSDCFYLAESDIKSKLPNKEKKLFYYSESGELTRAHDTDAGMDIRSAEDYVLKPNERHLFKTGIYGILPKGTDIKVTPRSGLALKAGITVANSPGLIDEDYRGEIGVILINHSNDNFIIKNGDRIAQLVLTKYEKIEFNESKELSNTDRGEGGFGSTGVK